MTTGIVLQKTDEKVIKRELIFNIAKAAAEEEAPVKTVDEKIQILFDGRHKEKDEESCRKCAKCLCRTRKTLN